MRKFLVTFSLVTLISNTLQASFLMGIEDDTTACVKRAITTPHRGPERFKRIVGKLSATHGVTPSGEWVPSGKAQSFQAVWNVVKHRITPEYQDFRKKSDAVSILARLFLYQDFVPLAVNDAAVFHNTLLATPGSYASFLFTELHTIARGILGDTPESQLLSPESKRGIFFHVTSLLLDLKKQNLLSFSPEQHPSILKETWCVLKSWQDVSKSKLVFLYQAYFLIFQDYTPDGVEDKLGTARRLWQHYKEVAPHQPSPTSLAQFFQQDLGPVFNAAAQNPQPQNSPDDADDVVIQADDADNANDPNQPDVAQGEAAEAEEAEEAAAANAPEMPAPHATKVHKNDPLQKLMQQNLEHFFQETDGSSPQAGSDHLSQSNSNHDSDDSDMDDDDQPPMPQPPQSTDEDRDELEEDGSMETDDDAQDSSLSNGSAGAADDQEIDQEDQEDSSGEPSPKRAHRLTTEGADQIKHWPKNTKAALKNLIENLHTDHPELGGKALFDKFIKPAPGKTTAPDAAVEAFKTEFPEEFESLIKKQFENMFTHLGLKANTEADPSVRGRKALIDLIKDLHAKEPKLGGWTLFNKFMKPDPGKTTTPDAAVEAFKTAFPEEFESLTKSQFHKKFIHLGLKANNRVYLTTPSRKALENLIKSLHVNHPALGGGALFDKLKPAPGKTTDPNAAVEAFKTEFPEDFESLTKKQFQNTFNRLGLRASTQKILTKPGRNALVALITGLNAKHPELGPTELLKLFIKPAPGKTVEEADALLVDAFKREFREDFEAINAKKIARILKGHSKKRPLTAATPESS